MRRDETLTQILPPVSASAVPSESIRGFDPITVFFVGPRLVCDALTGMLCGSGKHTFNLECLEDMQDTEPVRGARLEHGTTRPIILVLACCDSELPELIACPTVSHLLGADLSKGKSGPNKTVTIFVSLSLLNQSQSEIEAMRIKHHLDFHLSADCSAMDFREALLSAFHCLLSSITTALSKETGSVAKTRDRKKGILRDGRSVVEDAASLTMRKGGETGNTRSLDKPDQPHQFKGVHRSGATGSLRQKYSHLTACQQQVARLAAEGLSNAEIAELLSTTVATVKSHLQNTFKKTYVQRRSQLATLFISIPAVHMQPQSPTEMATDASCKLTRPEQRQGQASDRIRKSSKHNIFVCAPKSIL